MTRQPRSFQLTSLDVPLEKGSRFAGSSTYPFFKD